MPDPHALSRRLLAVAARIEDGSVLADIGTDHARLPAHMVAHGRCPRAIASDVRLAPLQRAAYNVRTRGVHDRVELRHGPGCRTIAAGEASAITITGMGGATIAAILADATHLLHDAHPPAHWILQPNDRADEVRRMAWHHGLDLTDECVVNERGQYYWILHWQPRTSLQSIAPSDDEAFWGPLAIRRPSPTYLHWLEHQTSTARLRCDHQRRGPARARAQADLLRCERALALAATNLPHLDADDVIPGETSAAPPMVRT